MLALALLISTLPMLVVHLASGKLLREWSATPRSWLGRKLSPRTLLRGEAAYWGMALLGWPMWHPWALKATVAVLFGVHMVAWAVGELRRGEITGRHVADAPRLRRAIIAFDVLEALVLVGLGWSALALLLGSHPGI